MTDLFEVMNSSPEEETPATPEPEPAGEENQVLAEIPVEPDNEEMIEETGEETVEDDAAPAGGQPAEEEPETPKQGNVVEEDPYEFDKCLITIAMALMPDDGHPDGREVMVGVRNHQDEPVLAMYRLSDLMPLPDPVQQLIEQLKEQLPARSAKVAEKKAQAKEAEQKRKAARGKTVKAAAKKPEKPKPTTMNLFDVFDQPNQQEVQGD